MSLYEVDFMFANTPYRYVQAASVEEARRIADEEFFSGISDLEVSDILVTEMTSKQISEVFGAGAVFDPGHRVVHPLAVSAARKKERDHIDAAVGPAHRETIVRKSAFDHQEGGSHYKSMAIQPVEFIHANKLGFLEGNIIKYVCRHASKNGEQDLLKAIHYAQLLIEKEYKK